jgi:UDP-glucuronate 4-epimerase
MISLIKQACGRAAERNLLPMQPSDVRDTFADIGTIQRDLGFELRTTIAQGVPCFVQRYPNYHRI